jgi:hypothetical protein
MRLLRRIWSIRGAIASRILRRSMKPGRTARAGKTGLGLFRRFTMLPAIEGCSEAWLAASGWTV